MRRFDRYLSYICFFRRGNGFSRCCGELTVTFYIFVTIAGDFAPAGATTPWRVTVLSPATKSNQKTPLRAAAPRPRGRRSRRAVSYCGALIGAGRRGARTFGGANLGANSSNGRLCRLLSLRFGRGYNLLPQRRVPCVVRTWRLDGLRCADSGIDKSWMCGIMSELRCDDTGRDESWMSDNWI